MRASFFRRFGGPEVLEYGELPDPAPGSGEVLVEIHAASVNAADWKMRAGQYGAAVSFPHVPGRDFSGVLVSGGGFFKPGDALFGVCEVPRAPILTPGYFAASAKGSAGQPGFRLSSSSPKRSGSG